MPLSLGMFLFQVHRRGNHFPCPWRSVGPSADPFITRPDQRIFRYVTLFQSPRSGNLHKGNRAIETVQNGQRENANWGIRSHGSRTGLFESSHQIALFPSFNPSGMAHVTPLTLFSLLKPDEDFRLQYRYIDLRRSELQNRIVFRARLNTCIREFMGHEGFGFLAA